MRAEFDPGQLLADWFAGTREDLQLIPARNAWWFGADADRDSLLAKRWGQDCADAASGSWGGLDAEPPGRLALVLLLDQLPRNLYRGTPQAFATDSLALDLCLNGHDRGMDQRLSLIERVFFWMPLQHVEDLELQDLGVRLYESGPATTRSRPNCGAVSPGSRTCTMTSSRSSGASRTAMKSWAASPPTRSLPGWPKAACASDNNPGTDLIRSVARCRHVVQPVCQKER
jgi:uncharacterized protein (DUF924 family)